MVTASTPLISRCVLGAMVVVGATACGAAAPAAKAPADDGLMSELEQRAEALDAELARLEGKSDKKKASSSVDDGDAAAQPGTTTATKAPEPPPAEPTASVESETVEEQKPASPVERCHTACRALESMQRSAERICSLAGESHERCTWARAQVQDARGRVERAGCSCEK